MGIIGAKWKPCLIDAVRERPKRPSELHREIPEAIPRVLDQQLKELEEHGIVEKKVYAEIPLRSEYSLTELGRSLLP
ncbi:transcriptional regulator, HxlR family [Phocaeicola coprophilus DSM 18228 = JCM 13818]|uniref:Transcriptional regulator, HxlR family n=3 Tax=Phocaeicola coprophilus TaxID=387090 RepID=S0F9I4_9BACT|nr:transcriptional regulator, HxlR family [Phocaeicola coprophilus DSM 18228 = JCM 13818]